jgi:hypothetical protein
MMLLIFWESHLTMKMRIDKKITVKGIFAPTGVEKFTSINSAYIYYEGDEYWSYGGHEHHSYSLPTRYLFEDWQTELKANLSKSLADYIELKEKAKLNTENKEKEQLKRLKEKYNDI